MNVGRKLGEPELIGVGLNMTISTWELRGS